MRHIWHAQGPIAIKSLEFILVGDTIMMCGPTFESLLLLDVLWVHFTQVFRFGRSAGSLDDCQPPPRAL